MPAYALGAFALVVTIASIPLMIDGHEIYDTVAYTFFALAMAAAGTLVAMRLPRNPIGWIMLGIAVQGGIGQALEGWGTHSDLPAADAVAWVSASFSFVGIGLVPVLLILFPTGGLPSPRWRVPFWLTVTAIPVSFASSAFGHSVQRYGRTDPNPVAAPGSVVDAIFIVSQVAFVLGLVTAVASIIVRYRRGGSLERQQLKWVAFSTGLLVVIGSLAIAFYSVSVPVRIAIAVTIMMLPITIAIAVLRYKLYAIDRIISRAASYAIVTMLLAGAYSLIVVTATAVIPSLPAVGVAVATLAAAALFLPLLRRIRRVVDRRFNREQYNSTRVVEQFGDRLRSGSDPHMAGVDVVRAVEATLQPAAIGMWTPWVDNAPRGDMD